MPALGKWGDRWFRHPGADMREPEKAVCWLTDIDRPEEEYAKRKDQLNHIARLHLKASLTAVDRFFMQVRRALTLAERASSAPAPNGACGSARTPTTPTSL